MLAPWCAGEPTGEPKNRVGQVISQAKALGANSQYGPGAIAFEFAQVRLQLLRRVTRWMGHTAAALLL